MGGSSGAFVCSNESSAVRRAFAPADGSMRVFFNEARAAAERERECLHLRAEFGVWARAQFRLHVFPTFGPADFPLAFERGTEAVEHVEPTPVVTHPVQSFRD